MQLPTELRYLIVINQLKSRVLCIYEENNLPVMKLNSDAEAETLMLKTYKA